MPDSDPWQHRRPRLAYPFTFLTQPDTVRLIAGEDYRYTLTGPALDGWLPAFLERLAGQDSLETLLAVLPAERRAHALQLVQHLYGERVLVDGPAAAAHLARCHRPRVRGRGPLTSLLSSLGAASAGIADVIVLCQDTLDYAEALHCNRECRELGVPFLWTSTAALNRGYVSPLFLPDAGPCFACLLRSFQRLSPAPELYDALLEHSRGGGPFRSTEFPPDGLMVLQGLVRWKLIQAGLEHPAAALYRLHVLEVESMEVTTHRVFADPECPDCRT